jgi:hypothetical protein
VTLLSGDKAQYSGAPSCQETYKDIKSRDGMVSGSDESLDESLDERLECFCRRYVLWYTSEKRRGWNAYRLSLGLKTMMQVFALAKMTP